MPRLDCEALMKRLPTPATDDRMISGDKIGFAALAFLFAGILTTSAAEAPLSPPEAALLRVAFAPNESALSDGAHEEIAAFASTFRRQSGRLTIKAYAGPPRDVSSTARSLALRRALSVRQKLIGEGIVTDRIHVRALGGTSDSGPQDRVDILLPGN